MQILAVDDERLELNALTRTLKEVFPDDAIAGFPENGRGPFFSGNMQERTNISGLCIS